MCATCGCSDDAGVRVIDPRAGGHGHGHGHDGQSDGHGGQGHGHGGQGHVHADHRPEHDTGDHDPFVRGNRRQGDDFRARGPEGRTVSLEVDLLARNDALAERNRRWLGEHGVRALNLMSSPGSGKTTLLERTIRELAGSPPCAVLEGDQETLLDADRITATGARVVQINTGAGCHLDADMMLAGLHALEPEPDSLLFVENVGNLVCPALFDLGESARVVIISVTEGADKPLKYPHMFRTADLVLVNKIDLLPHVDFDVERCAGYVRLARPDAEILHLSATRGDGMDAWYDWLRRAR